MSQIHEPTPAVAPKRFPTGTRVRWDNLKVRDYDTAHTRGKVICHDEHMAAVVTYYPADVLILPLDQLIEEPKP